MPIHHRILWEVAVAYGIVKMMTALVAVGLAGSAHAVTLGTFTFDDSKFGDTLVESDGGSHSSGNWLNVNLADPGNPGYLTGANFDTGVANIGINGPVTYEIGYSSGIANVDGFDLGIVTARYSVNDPITVALSSDGINWSVGFELSPGLAVATGVTKDYYYGGSSSTPAELFVTSLDLSDWGFGAGDSLAAIRITGTTELDLIRAAGLGGAVPEPASWAMMIAGFGLVGGTMRRQKRATAFA